MIRRPGALATRVFTVAGFEVRLWWLISALVVVLCLVAHGVCALAEFGISCGVVAHLPAVVGSWVLVWSGFTGPGASFGGAVANLFWTVVFSLLILVSAVAIGVGVNSVSGLTDDMERLRQQGALVQE